MAAAGRNSPEKRDRVTWDNGISHLGHTGSSVAKYRNAVFLSLNLSLGLFTLTFYHSFCPTSLFFAAYLASMCGAFSLLSLGQSISQTPEEIIGLLILSIYNVTHIESRSLCVRLAYPVYTDTHQR
jgi:hypothetical protein